MQFFSENNRARLRMLEHGNACIWHIARSLVTIALSADSRNHLPKSFQNGHKMAFCRHFLQFSSHQSVKAQSLKVA